MPLLPDISILLAFGPGLSQSHGHYLFTKIYCRTPVLGLGLGVDFVFAKNGQSLRNRMAEPPQPMAEPPQPEPSPKIYQNEVYYRPRT